MKIHYLIYKKEDSDNDFKQVFPFCKLSQNYSYQRTDF